MLAKLFRTGAGNHASFYSRNPCRCGDDLFQCARRCIGADCNNSKRRWTLLDIIGAVGPRTGAIPAQGARYEDTCVDRCTALDRLAGRRAATATTGAWCGRPDKHLDPSKQRPLYVLEKWLRLSANQPTGPNLAGYGSSTASSGSSATSGTSAARGSSAGAGVGAVSSSGISTTTSIPACGSFPPPNELCN
jgi:hypothetical protein